MLVFTDKTIFRDIRKKIQIKYKTNGKWTDVDVHGQDNCGEGHWELDKILQTDGDVRKGGQFGWVLHWETLSVRRCSS